MEDRQLQKLLGTDKQSQQMLLQFYKSNWERRKSLKEQEERASELSSVEKGAGDEENHPQYISVISHHDTKLDRNLDDEVMLSDGRENKGSPRSSLWGLRRRSGQWRNFHFNEPINPHTERKVTSKQRKEESVMGRNAAEGEGDDKTTSPALCLEEGMEEQERRPAEDRASQGVERDTGGATAVVGQDFPEGRSEEDGTKQGDERKEGGAATIVAQGIPDLQERNLQQEHPDGEGAEGADGAEPACPSAGDIPGWMRRASERPVPRGKAQDESQLDEEASWVQRSQSLR